MVTTTYYKIIGTILLDNGMVRHFCVGVADYTGAPWTNGPPIPNFERDVLLANELPRGTIIKTVRTDTTVITVNPTS
jgi:hypothetical protein